MVKLTKTEMQIVVDFIAKEHDCVWEIVQDPREKDCCTDEKALRKFLLAAKELGLDPDEGSYYGLEKKKEVNYD